MARASLTVRLVSFAVVLASMAAASVGALSYWRARDAFEAQARVRLRLLARDAANDVRRDLDGRVADVVSWTTLGVMRAIRFRDVDRELTDLLQRLLTGRAPYRGIACLDATGNVVAQAGDVTGLRYTSCPARPRLVVIAEPAGAPARLQIEAAVPDPDHDAGPIGTLVALVDPQHLVPPTAAAHDGEPGFGGLRVRTAGGVGLLDAGDAGAAGADALVGEAVVPALGTADVPALEVRIVESVQQALRPVAALQATLFRTAAAAILVASLLGAGVAYWIGAPLRRLTEAVQQIAVTDELELPPGLPTTGEVGVLARVFDRVLARVREQQAALLAQSRLATLGEIAASVTHEVRTPLSVLKTSAQLLARPGLPPEEQRQLATLLSSEVDRLNRVVTDLVDLARPRPAQYQVESLRGVAARAVRLFAASAARRGVALGLDVGDDPLAVRASRDQLQQVLVNLLHNALEATPAGGAITVAARRDAQGVSLTVADSGPGFPAALLDQLFTRFRTTKPDGTGLGLSISKRLIEEHGGRVAAENADGGGARVTVWLPSAPEVG